MIIYEKKYILKRHSNNIVKYPNLKSLLNAIKSLPHSNTDPERMFSLLTYLKANKRNKLSSNLHRCNLRIKIFVEDEEENSIKGE